jgi:hypothetical protein
MCISRQKSGQINILKGSTLASNVENMLNTYMEEEGEGEKEEEEDKENGVFLDTQ